MEKDFLDMSGVEKDAADAAALTREAEYTSEDNIFTHVFAKPFDWKGRSFEKLSFDWSILTGEDHLRIEEDLLRQGRTLVVPAFTGAFLAGMAARACTERDSVGVPLLTAAAIRAMPLPDFQAITGAARNFLLAAGS